MCTTDPKKKMARSKYIQPAYSASNILKSEEYIDQTFSSFLDWLDIFARDKKPMNLDKFITFATFDVIGEIIFSKQFGFLEKGEDIGNSIENSLALNAYIAVAGYFRWIHIALLANPVITWLSIMPMGHLFNTTNKVLAEREKNPDIRFDALSYWFKQNQEHPEGISLREAGTQALGGVGAGSDTVSCGIQSFIYHMLRQPTAWKRARDEINEAMRQGRCQDRVVSFADSQEMP